MATKPKVQPSGSSWYAIGAQTDTKPKGGKPVKGLTMNQVLGKAPRVTPSGAAGTTIQTPPKTQTVTTTTSTPPGQDWWSSQIGSRVALSASTPVLTAAQNQIGSSYGLTLRRNTTNNQPLFRLANQAAGTGTIEQSGFDSSGNPIYKDAAGNVIDVRQTPVSLDYVAVKPGQAGYLEGSLGRTAATSANTQQAIAEAAAARGARRSGMREYGARSETQNLQSALAGLAERAGGEYATNLGKWAELYTQIQQGLLPDATALAAPTTTTTEVPVASTSASTAAPEYLGYNRAPTPPPGTLGAGPGGAFMTLVDDLTLERNTTDKAIREGLRAFLKNPAYQLSPQQIRYINSLIAGRYKGNKKY